MTQPPTYAERQRLLDAKAILRALGCPAADVPALAEQVAASPGPIGQVAGRLLGRAK